MTLSAMLLQVHVPPPPLRAHVECLWYFEGPGGPGARELVLPTGAASLIVELQSGPTGDGDGRDRRPLAARSGCVVVGAHCRPLAIATARPAGVLGVDFRPGGARPLLGVPAGTLANQRVDLEAVLGPAASRLRERLLEAGGAGARFRVVTDLLLRRLRGGAPPHPAVPAALRRLARVPQEASIAGIAGDVGLSGRRFTQVFEDAVGLTPKRYARVRRFRAVLRRVGGQPAVDWADVAAACGYYDQAHLIREFSALSGLTPAAYLARRGPFANHVPLA